MDEALLTRNSAQPCASLPSAGKAPGVDLEENAVVKEPVRTFRFRQSPLPVSFGVGSHSRAGRA